MARQLILGTAGHIDHGKTALVRALTGVDTDRLPQEKQRGITIDIGFAHLEVGDHSLGIIDVPGHERFIKNMLAGASGIDLALLVVAADDSVMPQTREHLAILELLGIQQGVIALTKCDASDTSWIDLVEHDMRELVKGTFLERAPIVRTSAKAGSGLDDLKRAIESAAADVRVATDDEPFRLCVDRSFVAPGLGTVVTGTVRSGRVRAGEDVEWLPRRELVRVRSIQSHGHAQDVADRGQRAALNLPGVHHTDIVRGDELATPGVFMPSTRLAIELKALNDVPFAIRHRSRVRLHIGTGEVIASVRMRGRDRLEAGESCIAELVCARPVIAMLGQAIVVRAESPLLTLGGGSVLQPSSKLRMRDEEAWRLVERIGDRPLAAIRDHGSAGLDAGAIYRTCGLWGQAAESALRDLIAAGELLELPAGRYIDTTMLSRIQSHVRYVMERWREAHPTEPHVARPRLRQEIPYIDAALIDAAVDLMVEQGSLQRHADNVALPGQGPTFSVAQQRVHDAWVEQALASPFSPPTAADIAKATGVSTDAARKMARTCVKLGELVHLSDDIYLHADAERSLIKRVAEALKRDGGLTVSQIKTLLGTSRKYAVPICEHLDKLGVTIRQGDVRVPATEDVRS